MTGAVSPQVAVSMQIPWAHVDKGTRTDASVVPPQVDKLSFLPALEVLTGIPTGPSADFSQPFISQLKINGGGPIPGIGAQDAVPSFSSLAMKPTKVRRGVAL